MADNFPINIIKNIPPFLRVPLGNEGNSFILPDEVLTYEDIFLAQETLSAGDIKYPIEQETGDNILP